MKILHISNSDIRGGSSIAAFELHKALLKKNISSAMFVQKKFSSCKYVFYPKSTIEDIISQIKISINRRLVSFLKTKNTTTYSLGLFSSSIISQIEKFEPDIVHLHGIDNEIISLRDIYKIKQKLVWTTHDMWSFCGAEHYSDTDRFVEGYNRYNRPDSETGFDINYYTWKRKIKYLNKQITFISPSEWIFSKLKKSYLFKNNSSFKIPHVISGEWKPFDKLYSRKFFSLPEDAFIILFGSDKGNDLGRKGFSILFNSLKKINKNKKILILVFGGRIKEDEIIDEKTEIKYFGHFYDRSTLRLLYSASDVGAFPSLQEAFGLICAEASACGLPCIVFSDTGHEEIIAHKETGYIAKNNNLVDFSEGLNWLLNDEVRLKKISLKSIEDFHKKFNSEKILSQHVEIYKNIIKKN
jgi:glycosyltransferase involved in cell wall biosynthesis